MRARSFAIYFVMLIGVLSSGVAAQTVIVVRHGEKLDNSADSALSAAGEARAQRLAKLLAASDIRAIYTSQYLRTIQLAAPTANHFGIATTVVPARDTENLLAKIRAHGNDESVLVVGHSNTVPAILKALGDPFERVIAEEEFDKLFIVVVRPTGPARVVQLKY